MKLDEKGNVSTVQQEQYVHIVEKNNYPVEREWSIGLENNNDGIQPVLCKNYLYVIVYVPCNQIKC